MMHELKRLYIKFRTWLNPYYGTRVVMGSGEEYTIRNIHCNTITLGKGLK